MKNMIKFEGKLMKEIGKNEYSKSLGKRGYVEVREIKVEGDTSPEIASLTMKMNAYMIMSSRSDGFKADLETITQVDDFSYNLGVPNVLGNTDVESNWIKKKVKEREKDE